MTETVTLDVTLRAYIRRDGRRWVATCPMVGVVSQGTSSDDAKRCLQEAVELWFESCVERGVLDQALREANFRPVPNAQRATSSRLSRSKKESVLGDDFTIRLTIPAYQGPTVLPASA